MGMDVSPSTAASPSACTTAASSKAIRSYLLLYNVSKKQNFGQIIRSAMAFGVEEVGVVGAKKISDLQLFGNQAPHCTALFGGSTRSRKRKSSTGRSVTLRSAGSRLARTAGRCSGRSSLIMPVLLAVTPTSLWALLEARPLLQATQEAGVRMEMVSARRAAAVSPCF